MVDEAEALDSNDLSQRALCEKAGVSKSFVSHNFPQAAECSFRLFKVRKRIEKAKHLLTTTDKSVEKISDELGCCGPSYFCRTFKEATGYTTIRFRNYFAKHKRFPPDKGWLGAQKVHKMHNN